MQRQTILRPLALFVSLILIWEFLTWWLDTPVFILPRPTQILTALVTDWPIIVPHIGQTMIEVALGMFFAVLAGLITAGLLDFSPGFRQAFYPLLVISQTIPILALAPLLVIWFGFGLIPKVLIVTLFCYFPIAINTADGLTSSSPEHIELLQGMGATPWQVWRLVRLPAALPYFFSGLRIAATYSVVGAVVGEWVGASKGLGIYLLRSGAGFKAPQVFSAIVVISILSILLFGIVFITERWMLPWYFEERK